MPSIFLFELLLAVLLSSTGPDRPAQIDLAVDLIRHKQIDADRTTTFKIKSIIYILINQTEKSPGNLNLS